MHRTWWLASLVSVFPLAGAAGQSAPKAEVAQPLTLDASAPITVKAYSIFDDRRVHLLPPIHGEDQPRSRFAIKLYVTGGRTSEIIRMGPAIATELVDDQGRVVADASNFSPRALTVTQPISPAPMFLQNNYLPMEVQIKDFPRDAKTIKALRGYVNVAYGAGEVRVLVERVQSFLGREVESPELAAAGVKVLLVPKDELPGGGGDGTAFGLIYLEGEERVRSIAAYDGWWRPMAARTPSGEGEVRGQAYRLVQPIRGTFDEFTELIFVLHADVEADRIQFELFDIPLP